MKSFSTYDEPMKTHIEHLEDLLIDDSSFPMALLAELGELLSEPDGPGPSVKISVKWDGSPALVFGPDPADGRFFVATKAAFNKTPKRAKSHEDIRVMYPEAIQPILHAALTELAPLMLAFRDKRPDSVLQGDVLFLNDPEHRLPGSASFTPLKTLTIDGKSYVTFQPNTIIYGVEEGTHMADYIQQAGLGIALHTQYVPEKGIFTRGWNLSPEVFSSLSQTSRVFLMDANFGANVTDTFSFNKEEYADFQLALSKAREIEVDSFAFDNVSREPFTSELRRFINYSVRKETVESVDRFLVFLLGRQALEMSKRKTPAGKESARQHYADIMERATYAGVSLVQWFQLHMAIARAKTILIRAMERSYSGDFTSFVVGDTGIVQRTGPEGFVVSGAGRTVKLVDRQEFSRRNFNTSRNR